MNKHEHKTKYKVYKPPTASTQEVINIFTIRAHIGRKPL